jgi:tyrosyl-tRNA synthetase
VNVLDFLKNRGYIYQLSDEEGIREYLSKPAVLYQGFDPSADSFHAGHLMYFTAYKHFLDDGHKIIFLIGGGTGLVGDPTGKLESRKMLSEEELSSNLNSLEKQAKRLLGADADVLFLDNADWLSRATIFDYLRNVAPYISINKLLKHETYQTRLSQNLNLSLLEFLYSSLQAWDFLHLFKKYNCRLQLGGQDQWRNILDGVELVHKITGEEVFGLTFPLLTTGSGQKMGKSEGNAVWLDAQKTTPFEFYQYWLNRPDDELERDLRLFTLLGGGEISEIIKLPPQDIQKRLAFEVTKFVHGKDEAYRASKSQSVPTITFTRSDLGKGLTLMDVLTSAAIVSSKSEARRLIEQGGVSFDGEKVDDPNFLVDRKGKIRVGKSRFLRVKMS